MPRQYMPSVERSCQQCNRRFRAKASKVASGGGLFCSQECAYKDRSERSHIVRDCPECGQSFETYASLVAMDRGVYCSAACGNAAKRAPKKPRITLTCRQCGNSFDVSPCHADKVYCSLACCRAAVAPVERSCERCGKSFLVKQSRIAVGKGRFCSRECFHHHHHGRTYGDDRYINDAGYVMVLRPDCQPGQPKRYILEHRLVMEQILGRRLRSDEHLHHKDRNRQNNDPSNLQILTQSEHARLHASTRGGRWARDYDACVRCNRTSVPVRARGLCRTCYSQDYRAAK